MEKPVEMFVFIPVGLVILGRAGVHHCGTAWRLPCHLLQGVRWPWTWAHYICLSFCLHTPPPPPPSRSLSVLNLTLTLGGQSDLPQQTTLWETDWLSGWFVCCADVCRQAHGVVSKLQFNSEQSFLCQFVLRCSVVSKSRNLTPHTDMIRSHSLSCSNKATMWNSVSPQ